MGPRPTAAPPPHASSGPKLLFQSHNTYLNDVKDRAASGVTRRNGAFQRGVKRLTTLDRQYVGYAAPAKGLTEMGLPETEGPYYGEDQRGAFLAWWGLAVGAC
jgi:hypothetical protein